MTAFLPYVKFCTEPTKLPLRPTARPFLAWSRAALLFDLKPVGSRQLSMSLLVADRTSRPRPPSFVAPPIGSFLSGSRLLLYLNLLPLFAR